MTVIRILDFEATAFPEDGGRICEVGVCDLARVGAWWESGLATSTLFNPGVPIPASASAIHHIIAADVEDLPQLDPALISQEGAFGPPDYFAAHNAKGDKRYLTNHGVDVEGLFSDETARQARPWLCTYKCSMRRWPEASGHSVGALRYELELVAAGEREDRVSHNAGSDAYVTAALLNRLLDDCSLTELLDWSSKPVLQHKCWIGSWRGHKWSEVDSGFLHWIIGKDFDEDVLFTVKHELARREEEMRKLQREADQDDVIARVAYRDDELDKIARQRDMF